MADQNLRLEWIDPKTLTPNPHNWRVHPPAQREALQGVLAETGWAGALLWNERTERLVDGHLRLDVALRDNLDAVPVLIGSWSDAQEKEILATLDPIAAMAEADSAQLDALLREVNSGSAAVMDMLAGLAEGAGLYLDEKPISAGGDEFDTEPQEGETRAKRGDLWQLGDHRLLVDDCTIAANVERLMGGEKAALTVTSPPYFNQRPEYAIFATYEAFNKFIGSAIDSILAIAGNPYILAWNTGDNQADCLPMVADQTVLIKRKGLTYLDTIVWKKAGAVYSIPRSAHIRTNNYFYPALSWEPIIIFRNGDKMPKFDEKDEDRVSEFGTNVWEINQVIGSQQAAIGHPALFPVELVFRVMMAYSTSGAIVFEPFGGGGTTLVAAERLGRKARLMEIEPRYADVILRRWEAESGQEAQLVERVTDE